MRSQWPLLHLTVSPFIEARLIGARRRTLFAAF